jgi:hypothetical protein
MLLMHRSWMRAGLFGQARPPLSSSLEATTGTRNLFTTLVELSFDVHQMDVLVRVCRGHLCDCVQGGSAQSRALETVPGQDPEGGR